MCAICPLCSSIASHKQRVRVYILQCLYLVGGHARLVFCKLSLHRVRVESWKLEQSWRLKLGYRFYLTLTTVLSSLPLLTLSSQNTDCYTGMQCMLVARVPVASLTSHSTLHALLHRFGKCKAELLKQVEEEGNTAALCSQLGAVCGSEGDCHRQLNQPGEAKACFEESVQHLQACSSQDAEVRSEL